MNDTHQAIDAAIDPIVVALQADDPDKVAQLVAHVKTVHAVIDQVLERAFNRAAEKE